MSATVFFSWQSDIRKSGRNFIENALRKAVDNISNDIQVDERPRETLEIDRDTLGVPGSPPIFDTITQKIDRAAAFVCDLTFVSKRPNGDPIPNPNVLIEYGYALKSLSYHRIVQVMIIAHGHPDRTMPFNMALNRFPLTYNLPEDASDQDRKMASAKLANDLEGSIKLILDSEVYEARLTKERKTPEQQRKIHSVRAALKKMEPHQVEFLKWALDRGEQEETRVMNAKTGLHPHSIREGISEGEKHGLMTIRIGSTLLSPGSERIFSINPSYKEAPAEVLFEDA